MLTLLIAVGLLILFVVITLWEAWFIKHKLGVDIVANINATFARGDTAKGVFKASGAVAFVIVQPFLLTSLLGRISDTVVAIVTGAALRTLTFIGGDDWYSAISRFVE